MHYLVIWSNCPVFPASEWPVDVQCVLVECQHKHNQDEESVEHGEKEDGLVSQLF